MMMMTLSEDYFDVRRLEELVSGVQWHTPFDADYYSYQCVHVFVCG